MLKFLLLLFLWVTGCFCLQAQPALEISMTTAVSHSNLLLDVFIQRTGRPEVALGNSNFDIELDSQSLDISKAVFSPGEFDQHSDTESYEAMGHGTWKYLVMNVQVKMSGGGTGKIVTSNKQKIGSFSIPIIKACAVVTPVWKKERAVLSAYSKSAFSNNLTPFVHYIPSPSVSLSPEKETPKIREENGKLLSSSETGNSWLLDGVPIAGADTKEFIPKAPGSYSVLVKGTCMQEASTPYSFTVTGLSDFLLSYSFVAKPSHFISESIISYTLPFDAQVRLQLCDLNGIQLTDLESGFKSQGQHEFLLKASQYHLAAGAYLLRLSVADKEGILKLVALK